MFKPMRRIAQQLSDERSIEVLKQNTSGVLALLDENDYPYTVPLSYVYHDHKIYFHSAKFGHKINAIHHYSKASFCIIDQDDVKPEELTTYYRSVIAFGKVRLLKDDEKYDAIQLLGMHYYKNETFVNEEIERFKDAFEMIEFDIEHITGKEAKELIIK